MSENLLLLPVLELTKKFTIDLFEEVMNQEIDMQTATGVFAVVLGHTMSTIELAYQQNGFPDHERITTEILTKAREMSLNQIKDFLASNCGTAVSE